MNQLQELHLSRIEGVTDSVLKDVLSHTPLLKVLALSLCHALSYNAASIIATYARQLKTLLLVSCAVNDEG